MSARFIPLPGHRFHDLTDAELRFVIKDAGEARANLGHYDPACESKYADQVNDAVTILSYRKGGPLWSELGVAA